MSRIDRNYDPILIGLIVASTLWSLLLGAHLELTDQEAYYWSWSENLAWAYYDHPPFQAWMTRLFTSIFGDSSWAVRLPALVFKSLCLWFFWIWARDRYNNSTALRALWIVSGSFIALAGGLIALPDSFMLPFALLTLLFAERRQPVRCGIVLGLAGLAKWSAAALIPGVCVAFLMSYRGRRDVIGFFKVAFVATLIQAPVLYWNAQNDWLSFEYHLQTRHDMAPGFVSIWQSIKNLFQFSTAQFLLGGLTFTAAFLQWAADRSSGAYYQRIYRDSIYHFRIPTIWWVLPFFLIFGFSALRGEIRFYWTAFAIFPISAWIAQRLSHLTELQEERFRLRQFVLTCFTMTLLSTILVYPVGYWVKPLTDNYRGFDIRFSPRGDFTGWKDWSIHLREQGLLRRDMAFVASDYRLAAQGLWGSSLSTKQFSTLGRLYQWEFMNKGGLTDYKEAIFFWDNRRHRRKEFASLCGHPIKFNRYNVELKGKLIKKILWAHCKDFKGMPH